MRRKESQLAEMPFKVEEQAAEEKENMHPEEEMEHISFRAQMLKNKFVK